MEAQLVEPGMGWRRCSNPCMRLPTLKCMFVWILGILLVFTYVMDFWSINLEYTPDNDPGKAHLKMVARLKFLSWTSQKQNLSQEYDVTVKDEKRTTVPFQQVPDDKGHIKNVPEKNEILVENDPQNNVETKHDEKPPTNVNFASVDDVPNVITKGTNCAKLAEGDSAEIILAKKYQTSHKKKLIDDSEFIKMASDCENFKRTRQYMTKPVSQEEADFGIAFSLVVFKDVEQIERLLRAVYRPQNFYCIHVDTKSKVLPAMEAIANCFDNVFIASRRIDVQWAYFSVLEPELVCMEDLWKYQAKWKYFINLTGQEFPLKTNLDLVRILTAYNGGNDLEGTKKRRNVARTQYVHNGMWQTEVRKDPPPIDITFTKGSVHIVVQKGFVDYVLHNPDALKFREWVKDTGVPDETFFSSLNHSPQLRVPGAYTGEPETDKFDEGGKKPFMTRFKNWGTWPFNWKCAGQRVRMVCVFDVGDVHMLASRAEMFANKFYLDAQPLAYECMEEIHYNRTRDEITGTRDFDNTLYSKFDFVKNHIP